MFVEPPFYHMLQYQIDLYRGLVELHSATGNVAGFNHVYNELKNFENLLFIISN
jgi:hypothetical protein